jgi:hypothetical protein
MLSNLCREGATRSSAPATFRYSRLYFRFSKSVSLFASLRSSSNLGSSAITVWARKSYITRHSSGPDSHLSGSPFRVPLFRNHASYSICPSLCARTCAVSWLEVVATLFLCHISIIQIFQIRWIQYIESMAAQLPEPNQSALHVCFGFDSLYTKSNTRWRGVL